MNDFKPGDTIYRKYDDKGFMVMEPGYCPPVCTSTSVIEGHIPVKQLRVNNQTGMYETFGETIRARPDRYKK